MGQSPGAQAELPRVPDQVVRFEVGRKASATRIKGATLKVCPGAPHGITDTHEDQLGVGLLVEFLTTRGTT